MKRFIPLLLLSALACAEPLKNLVSVEDGLADSTGTSSSDDYIRLTLVNPDYQSAAAIHNAIDQWLGPNMVIVQSKELLLVQAPRDPGSRISFISALLDLDIQQ